MLATQTLSVVFGSFINYAVMISVINNQRDVLLTNNGSGQWSGQYFSSVNTQATVWALSKELYHVGKPYVIVPIGLAIGFLAVCLHRVITHFKPKIGKLDLRDVNLPIIFQYSGWFAYNQTQSCIMLTTVFLGVFIQYYLRNYKLKIFKRYSYIVAAGLDGGTLLTIFILSFAVFGTAGPAKPFPTWAGNPADYPDRCPDPSSS
ncbi:OPT superfamily oligopeptide transporter [Meira miltonrushii]|uniref:OPT superfamily oligopeptide transporter n=1 Tax=Meira miltonrushii TaxID=1280837 RepID=A0A316VAZ7_9BASI|nr:OPT superfamily oligopeptide transporter [Meira miltonrushii]PWN34797.1 OPT superfamily oligopeptide transporter [Meira miltonrushii]